MWYSCFHCLAPNSVYKFRVRAATVVGPGPFSHSTFFTTPENGTPIPQVSNRSDNVKIYPLNHAVPTTPRELTVLYLNSTALEITWEHPLCDYGVRRGYTVSPQQQASETYSIV